ncbi:MAG: type 4a pilus biogenesis protein PilO [Planctomycetales bacterium]|nr:type 4a pilus biogenesis protein PilO [Planctomycetales bacterium]
MKNPDKQQWVILMVSGLMFVGFGVFRYLPIVRQNIAVGAQMDQQKLTVEQITSSGALLPELTQQKKKLEAELDAFTRKIPEGRNFAQLWQEIADVMNACRLTDQLVQPGTELTSDTVCCIPLTIECKGTAEQIFMFFQSLEKMDRLIRVDDILLENDSGFSAQVKLTAKANVYYQPSDARND